MANLAKFGKIVSKQSALLLCDMQEKFRPSIQYFNAIVANSNRMLRASKVLNLPVYCTEQYPKGLGRTVTELGIQDYGIKPVEKTLFSMCIKPIVDDLKAQHPHVDSVMLCGIESHVCVQQTAIDFKASGYEVFVIVDACSSRGIPERIFAFDLMKKIGCWLTTTESAILSLAGGSDHPQFKELQGIIKDLAPDTGLSGFVPSKI